MNPIITKLVLQQMDEEDKLCESMRGCDFREDTFKKRDEKNISEKMFFKDSNFFPQLMKNNKEWLV